MSAIARLIWIYFMATPLGRGLTVVGFLLMLAGMSGYLYYPAFTLGTGRSDLPLWYQGTVTAAPWLGLILLFFGSSTLPGVIERMLLGRGLYVLPHARLCLLLSVLATASLIALLTATGGTLTFFYYPADYRPERIFSRTWLVTFSNVGLMYTALWIVGKARGIWLLLGSLLIAIGIVGPLGAIGRPSGVPPITIVGLAIWVAFVAVVLFGARLRRFSSRALTSIRRVARNWLPGVSYSAGTELDLLLGTMRPWVVAIGQAVPVAAAGWLIFDLRAWLFFLALFTAISGAITSTAAARSRALWLKRDWTRAEMFQRVEAAYWRYNAYPLGVLLLLFVAFGSYRELPTPVLALGVPLLVLGSVVSTQLGLMMTRGLRWLEVVLGVGTMGLLMWTSIAVVGAETRLARAIELEVLLAAAALVFRFWAKTRWQGLDWLVCRDAALTRGAG